MLEQSAPFFNSQNNPELGFIKDVEQIIGRDRVTLRRWWLAGKFPKPVKLNDSILSWHIDAIEKWINQTVRTIEVAAL